MAEITRLSGRTDWIDLEFVERQRTPPQLMKLGIRLHLAGLSLSNTVRELEKFGVQRSRKAVHDWVQKADLQPADGANPNHVALDETVIRVNDEQYWLYAAVDPDTNNFLHIRLFPTYTTALTEIFLRELREKHDVSDVPRTAPQFSWARKTRRVLRTPCFSSMVQDTFRRHSADQDSDFDMNAMEIETASNVSLER
jgi:transposase-like protein